MARVEALLFDLGGVLIDVDWRRAFAAWSARSGVPAPELARRFLLERLAARVPLYVFSNTNIARATFWRPRYRTLLAPVRQVFCSCDLRMRKPQADAFRGVAQRIGTDPGRIAFFDDLEENVAGARAAGLAGVHVPSADRLAKLVERIPLS